MVIDVEIRKVVCEKGILQYHLIRKPVKNINLRIKSDGKIVVSANPMISEKYIDTFVLKNQEYIFRALKKIEENLTPAMPMQRQYVDDETFVILGEEFHLKVLENKMQKEAVWTEGKFLFLRVKNKDYMQRKEKLVDEWLKELCKETFQEVCTEVYQIFERYVVPYPELKIRKMTSLWGSCRPHRAIITLNSHLIESPRSCIEYVMVHEFAHFIYPNHSKKFHDFMTMLMPDWKVRKKMLNQRVKFL